MNGWTIRCLIQLYLKVGPAQVMQVHLKQMHILSPGAKGISVLPAHVEFNVIFFFFREMGLEVAISVILQK